MKNFHRGFRAPSYQNIGVLLLLLLALAACDSKSQSTSAQPAPAEPAIAEAPTAANAAVNSEVEALFNRSCVSCHLSGVANAPRKGDVAEWQRRLDNKGMEQLIVSVRKGLGAMPPMGMCNDCSDQDFQALIEWMVAAQP